MSSRGGDERKRFFAHKCREFFAPLAPGVYGPVMRYAFTLCAMLCAIHVAVAEIPLPSGCEQIVCVTSPAWPSNTATLQRWERTAGTVSWSKVGDRVAVLLGERGLGWGLGLPGLAAGDGPRKAEGDRKAPAGIFFLSGAFGRSSSAVGRLPWRTITPTLEAVDDPASRFYNRIVDRKDIPRPDWRSSERMATIPDYKLGIVVAQNPQAVPGAGSCVFIHLWRGTRSGTAGCTVLREPDLVTLVRWLDPARKPVLIQLPQAVMRRAFPEF